MRSSARIFLSLAFAMAILVPAQGQGLCFFGDDGFNLGCCAAPAPALPPFPGIQQQAAWGCFNNCNVQQLNALVQVAPPNVILCDFAVSNITITLTNAAGVVLGSLSGPLFMKYSRTWREPTAIGGRQVWRWLVNTDLSWLSPAIVLNPCIPPEVGAPFLTTVHMDGHIDYACDPFAAVGFNTIISLNRLPGCIQFGPLSQQPIPALAGTNSSFHLVGPAPFAFVPVPEPQGGMIAEAVRPSRLNWAPFSYNCVTEEEMVQGAINTVSADCLCTTINPGPWRHQQIVGTVCCNGITSSFNPIAIPALPLTTGFVTRSLGTWPAAAGPFAAGRNLFMYFGVLQFTDLCVPAPGIFSIHAVAGVATTNHPVSLFPGPVGAGCGVGIPIIQSAAIDLQNLIPLVQAAGTLVNLPGYGALSVSTLVFNLNTP